MWAEVLQIVLYSNSGYSWHFLDDGVTLLFGDRVLAPATLANPADPQQPTALTFQLAGVAAGSYPVRLRVDGADSIPVDFSGATPAFAANQQVVVS